MVRRAWAQLEAAHLAVVPDYRGVVREEEARWLTLGGKLPELRLLEQGSLEEVRIALSQVEARCAEAVRLGSAARPSWADAHGPARR